MEQQNTLLGAKNCALEAKNSAAEAETDDLRGEIGALFGQGRTAAAALRGVLAEALDLQALAVEADAEAAESLQIVARRVSGL